MSDFEHFIYQYYSPSCSKRSWVRSFRQHPLTVPLRTMPSGQIGSSPIELPRSREVCFFEHSVTMRGPLVYDGMTSGRWPQYNTLTDHNKTAQPIKVTLQVWRSCKTKIAQVKNNNPIRPQFCTCHDSRAVVTCANSWPDWNIRIKFRTRMIFTVFI